VDEDSNVAVQAIYEPPQEGSADRLLLERHTEQERAADAIAETFG
jgi:nuclear protein localization family protein 4